MALNVYSFKAMYPFKVIGCDLKCTSGVNVCSSLATKVYIS